MDIQFGLENEIGITRQNPEGIDVVAESIGLVRSATAEGVRLRWDYNFEDPHLDARGFRVKELKQDSDEAEYFAQDASRSLSNREIKSDYVLKNGARFYNDHAIRSIVRRNAAIFLNSCNRISPVTKSLCHVREPLTKVPIIPSFFSRTTAIFRDTATGVMKTTYSRVFSHGIPWPVELSPFLSPDRSFARR